MIPLQGGQGGQAMCNNYRLKTDVASIVDDFANLKIKICFGDAFTMLLTMASGPDIAPHHDRQIAILNRAA